MDATPDLPAISPTDVARARMAVSIAFVLLGLATGVWAVHIPIIQARLGIDAATLGFALFAMASGAVIAMPVTGWAVGRFGSRLPTTVLMLSFPIFFTLPILSGSVVFLFGAMVLFGATMSALDVAGNVQASEVERARGRPTMSSFHGFYSVGGLIGAAISAGIVSAGFGDGRGAAAAAVLFLITAGLAVRHLYPSERPIWSAGPRFAFPSRSVVSLGAIAFLCFAIEGAIGDWSALFLSTVKLASASAAAIGFALYSCAMAFCRLAGDWVVSRLGGRVTVVLGGGLIALGMAIAILSPWALVCSVGFGMVGIGAANVVPVVFSAASRARGVTPSYAIAAVTTLGYSGFMIAPPLIGMISNAAGLSLGLWVVAIGGVIVATIAASRQWSR